MDMPNELTFPNTAKNPLLRVLFHVIRPVLNIILDMKGINHHYQQAACSDFPELFAARVLKSMNIAIDVCAEELDSIPREGPLVIVSNHPFGGLEGLILPTVFDTIRPDMKFIANFILSLIPEMSDSFFSVNPFGGSEATARNFKGVRRAVDWIKAGHAVTIFPAGEVSHLQIRHMQIMDGPWNPMAARIIQSTRCTTVPVFFYGLNSRFFQAAGVVHPGLRTLMLTRELLKKQNSTISVRIGKAISPEKSAVFDTPEKLTDYLRLRTYILQNREAKRPRFSFPRLKMKRSNLVAPIADPEKKEDLVRELDNLPARSRLIDKAPMMVYVFEASQGPALLNEIGRLREITFRQVGEGSGKCRDLDEFDKYYEHIVVWDQENHEIVGSYRAGKTDEIMASKGKKGLYTSTLFSYRSDLLRQISPALELGRSFVQIKYQRHFSSLLLLWKGIGRYVSLNPQYRFLIGPVSISRDYSDLSRWFLKQFLQQNYHHPELAKKVKPLNPLKLKDSKAWSSSTSSFVVQDLNEVEELIGEMESEMHGIPVLLRQYLKLEAKMLGLNLDPDFGYVLDALLLVDLAQLNPKLLNKYMDRDGMERFLSFHSQKGNVSGRLQSNSSISPAPPMSENV